jgi:hypothetical protein
MDNAVYLAHRLALFTAPLGHQASINDGKVIAICLHLTNPFFESVVVPNVPAAANVTATFMADTTAEQFAVAAPNTPDATNVTTRRSIWVPPPYMDKLHQSPYAVDHGRMSFGGPSAFIWLCFVH